MRTTAAAILLCLCALAAAPATQPYTWKNVTLVAGGFVPGIIFSPKQPGLMYARTDIGGAYRFDAADNRWTPLTDWVGPDNANLMGCESIAPDPVDPAKVYIAAGTYSSAPAAILRSADQGRTFQVVDVPFAMGGNENGRGVGERLDIDPNETSILYFASRHDGLWISRDSALTWHKLPSPSVPASPAQSRGGFGFGAASSGAGLSFVVFDRSSGAAGAPTPSIYVGAAIRNFPCLWHSSDAGKTFAPVPGAPANLMAHHAQLDSAGNLYLALSDNPGPNGLTRGAVWKLATHAGVWTNITPERDSPPSTRPSALTTQATRATQPPSGQAPYGFGGLAVDPNHPGTFLVATLNRWKPGDEIFRSTNGGKTYTSLRDHSQRDASLSPYLIWGDPQPSFGWWFAAVAIDPFDSNHALYGTGATIWGTHDLTQIDAGRATHWSVAAAGIEETAILDLASPPAGPHLLSALGDIGGYRHDDLNQSPAAGMFADPIFDNTNSIDFAELNPSIVVRAGVPRHDDPNSCAYSLDGAQTWTPMRPPAAARGRGFGFNRGAFITLTADGQTFLASAGGAWSWSADRGHTWTACRDLPAQARPVADRADPNLVYAVASGKLLVSFDTGKTFAPSAISGIPVPAAPPRGRGGFFFNPGPRLRAVPGRRGDLWLYGREGLFHAPVANSNFVKIPSVDSAVAIGFGKPPPGSDYPAVYFAGAIGGLSSLFRSDDAGGGWVRITDDAHQYSALPTVITGDPRVYGRLYIGTNGRGILYGDIRP